MKLRTLCKFTIHHPVFTGARVETSAIELREDSRHVVVNGAAARRFRPGDTVIIAAFCLADEPVEPRMIAVDCSNRFLHSLTDGTPAPPELQAAGGR